MKFFIDTANIDEIKKANEMGLVDGVTTNPSLVSKEGREFKDLIKEICGMVGGPVNAEVVSTDSKGMVDEARDLVKIAKNIVVKIPLIKEGLKAVKKLSAPFRILSRGLSLACCTACQTWLGLISPK